MLRLVILYFLILTSSIPLLSQTAPEKDSVNIENIVFEKIDVEASFPGGLQEWRKYLEKNLNPNVPIDNGAPIGIYTIIAQFIVDKNGALSDIKALTKFGYGMEQEVIRIIQKSTQWVPAKQNGRSVKAYRRQPITFVVEDDDIDIVMNEKYILYTGKDNIIKIAVSKVKKEDLELDLSQGKIILGEDGDFHIRVNNPGKSILYISNRKKGKQLGSVYFIVKAK